MFSKGHSSHPDWRQRDQYGAIATIQTRDGGLDERMVWKVVDELGNLEAELLDLLLLA